MLVRKRSHDDMEGTLVMQMFQSFRSELDEHHDRRERVIKASRDVTAASKKVIFSLQRSAILSQHFQAKRSAGAAVWPHYNTIRTHLSSVAADLQGINAARYERQITWGLQEWMEAVAFETYLEEAKLLTFDDAVARLRSFAEGSAMPLTYKDYLLGIYDTTGELMRFAITTMATGGQVPAVSGQPDRNVVNDLRMLRAALESLNSGRGPFANEVDKKAQVMRTSVEKAEKALYGLVVRGAEMPAVG
ncbi:Translin [Piedraia hortae CBS 480.64]|uniref:Translin n=1 Tax=Piedraia hortae CBS 480.64 TaxID=1314780 RepID=A0A6A7BQV8_9PEZI|nr:Translin [Piedraia hortae CBS 480.64]